MQLRSCRRVKEAADSLREFADRGQVVPEFDNLAIRELLVSPYRLVYRVKDDQVIILALVHGARRVWRI